MAHCTKVLVCRLPSQVPNHAVFAEHCAVVVLMSFTEGRPKVYDECNRVSNSHVFGPIYALKPDNRRAGLWIGVDHTALELAKTKAHRNRSEVDASQLHELLGNMADEWAKKAADRHSEAVVKLELNHHAMCKGLLKRCAQALCYWPAGADLVRADAEQEPGQPNNPLSAAHSFVVCDDGVVCVCVRVCVCVCCVLCVV